MTGELLFRIAALAALDSLNPATIVAVTLILIAGPRRPGLTAAAAVAGAGAIVFALGAVLYWTAGAAADAVDGIVIALRFVAFGAAAIAMAVAGFRRLRDRPRRGIQLPDWFSPWTALPFGVLITAADLPNAFPYFIAIQQLIAADLGRGVGLLVLAGYALVYCLPCLVLLVVGLIARQRTREGLQRFVDRFGRGTVRRSVPFAIALWASALAVASIPFWL